MFITKRLKQWRLLRSELDSREQYEQFLELVKADLEDRKQLFMGRPAYRYWSRRTCQVKDLTGRKRIID